MCDICKLEEQKNKTILKNDLVSDIEFLEPVIEMYKTDIIVAHGTKDRNNIQEWLVKINGITPHNVFQTSEDAISFAKNLIDLYFK